MPKKQENEKKPTLTRTLPNSSDAEMSLLGCLITDGAIALDVCASVSAEDFYYPAHKIIFQAVQKLSSSNRAVDIVTLTELLTREDSLDKAGGLNYLTALGSRVPSAANASEYIDIIKRTSVMRRLIRSCSEIIEEAYAAEDATDALANAEKRIYSVGENRSEEELYPLSKGLGEVVERLNTIKTDADAFKGVPTGFWMLDRLTNGLHNGELIVIAGRPGTGKSSLAMNIVEHAALKNYSCAVFSLEMPRIQIAQRLLCSCSGIPLSRMTSGEFADNDRDWKSIYATAATLSHLKVFIDDSSLITPAQLLSKCRRLKNREGLDLVLVDYIQLMTTGKRTENRQQEISEISRNLKILAKELDVPVIALSQMSRQIESRPGRPQLSDLRESGAIEQDADIVMFIHREKTDEDAPNKDDRMLIVAKHRNGALDDIPLKWIGELVKFVPYESDDLAKLKQYEQEKRSKKKKEKENRESPESAPVPVDQAIAEIIKSDLLKDQAPDIPENSEVGYDELELMALGVPEEVAEYEPVPDFDTQEEPNDKLPF